MKIDGRPTLLLAALIGGITLRLACTRTVLQGHALSLRKDLEEPGSQGKDFSIRAGDRQGGSVTGAEVEEPYRRRSDGNPQALSALLSNNATPSFPVASNRDRPTGRAPIFTELGVTSEGEYEQPEADSQESDAGAGVPSEEGDGGHEGSSEGSGVYSKPEHWYSIRTNFAPRLLRVLAKKSETEKGQHWYTILTNFKPHILKLTPEEAA